MSIGLFDTAKGTTVAFIIAKVIIYPALFVWGLNKLFALNISYNDPQNWLAAVVILLLTKAI